MRTYLLFLSILILFTGCGGGGSDSVVDPVEEKTTTFINGVDPSKNEPTWIDSSYTSEPLYSIQWSHSDSNTNPAGSGYNASGDIDYAWNYNQGDHVKIAIIDISFDLYHEDVPHYLSYDAVNDVVNPPSMYDSTHNGHGTSVASIAGAPINGQGIVGVAPHAAYMLIKIEGSVSSILRALQFAHDNGADIISCSWGTNLVTQAEIDMYDYLKSEGIFVVFSAGNDGADLDVQNNNAKECAVNSTICVGATNEQGNRTSYSNYGSVIDFLAPGGDYGLIAADLRGTAGYNNDYNNAINDNAYTFFAGTSASAPYTAGVLALLLSEYPAETYTQIYDRLKSLSTKDPDNGWGLINAYNSITK